MANRIENHSIQLLKVKKIMYDKYTLYLNYTNDWNFRISTIPYAYKAGMVLIFVATLLHILDRQIEFTSRTDFLWKDKLKIEQEEVETMRGINKVNNL